MALIMTVILIGCDPPPPPPPPPLKVFEGVLKKVKTEHPAIWRRDKERTHFTFKNGTVLTVRGVPEGMPYAIGKLNRIIIEIGPRGNRLVSIGVLDR